MNSKSIIFSQKAIWNLHTAVYNKISFCPVVYVKIFYKYLCELLVAVHFLLFLKHIWNKYINATCLF